MLGHNEIRAMPLNEQTAYLWQNGRFLVNRIENGHESGSNVLQPETGAPSLPSHPAPHPLPHTLSMLGLHAFNSLSLPEQLNYLLDEGRYLARRNIGSYYLKLYDLGSFYVELHLLCSNYQRLVHYSRTTRSCRTSWPCTTWSRYIPTGRSAGGVT